MGTLRDNMKFKWVRREISRGHPEYDLYIEGRKNRIATVWRQSNSGTLHGLRYSSVIDMDKDGYNGRFGPQIWYSLNDAKAFVEKYYGLKRSSKKSKTNEFGLVGF